MRENLISFFDKSIRFSFYLLFFLVPLLMYPSTYELFEFNKMWAVFMLTLFIGFCWISKAILKREFVLKHTPLDLPLFLFLLSQTISTIISIDPHVSLWGYYSRFNGGLLSTLAYIFLYYAFVNNLIGNSIKILLSSLLGGLIVALWGFPSHFGYDPTCFVFRGTLDVSCWTAAFQPKIRIFSTLGQPNWLATYLSILIPISIAFFLDSIIAKPNLSNFSLKKLLTRKSIVFFVFAILSYLCLLFTNSQSGFIGLWVGLITFISFFLILEYRKKHNLKNIFQENNFKLFSFILLFFILITFFLGTPISKLNFLTFKDITENKLNIVKSQIKEDPASLEFGTITDSGKIRLIVWRGAIDLFKKHPLFGSGVETFAYAYYQTRPVEHNLLSEWDYLYNKAHNEYLNYLATTGVFGLLSYLAIIFVFLISATKKILNDKQTTYNQRLIAISLVSAFISILIANFFGFSVVIINLFLFLIPALFYDLTNSIGQFDQYHLNPNNKPISSKTSSLTYALILITFAALLTLYFELFLIRFWKADTNYALGNNLDKAGEYSQAYPYLVSAVNSLPNEDLYKDELSLNLATLSYILFEQKESSQAAEFAKQAKMTSDYVIKKHPNNVSFYKSRTRVFYLLSQIDKNYLNDAFTAIDKAAKLAPTDAKIAYSRALVLGQMGKTDATIEALQKTINLKPDYRDAHYTLALFYNQKAKEETDFIKINEYEEKAKNELNYILTNLGKDDINAKTLLESIK